MQSVLCDRPLRIGAAALALVATACGQGPAEPREVTQISQPSGQLSNLYVRPFPYHAQGSFEIAAGADSATAFGQAPVLVRIRTSGGDDEQVEMAGASGTLPRQIMVSMRDGRHVAELKARMDGDQLRFGSFGITGANGLLHVVDGDPAAALPRVRGWPEVRSASPNAMVSIDLPGERRTTWTIIGTLPMDEAAASPRNGTLEIGTGETATVEYRGTDGAPASFAWTYSSRSEADIRAFVPLLAAAVERTLYGDGAARPPLLIDAESFAAAAWHAGGTRVPAAEAVAGLPAGYTVVSQPRGARCRGSVIPRDCSDVVGGTFIYTTGMYRGGGVYDMIASFRAPTTPLNCVRQQSFRFSLSGGEWRVESTGPDSGC